MDDLTGGAELLLTWASIFYLLIGLLTGFVVGVLPGFQGASGAALLLPFAISLPLEHALLMMVGIYAGATYSGAVPAILMNVPGTAGAAATGLDGWPMAQQGRAEEAIGIARMASAIGGVIGVTLIVSSIGTFTKLALTFGSREIFAIAIVGLLMIGSLVGENAWKGVLAGLFGVLISMVSASPLTGQPRLTFGFLELYEGVPFIPVLIGLFAYSQMFALAIETTLMKGEAAPMAIAAEATTRQRLQGTIGRVIGGAATTFRYPRTLIRSSIIGTVIGVVPGAGAAIANFVSYGAAKRASKTPERFGTGHPEGVVASEAADNGVTGGTLVPTLTLGLPGSASAAVMLAALILHGVQPGPRVMVTHGPEAYAILLGLGLASILIIPLGILLATPMTLILKVKPAILVPTILLASTVGVFAFRSSMFDVGLALMFGVIGLFMIKNGYSVVPLVLGLILGPLAERNFIRSLSIGQDSVGYFFGSTSTRVIWAAVVVLLVSNFVRRYRKRQAGASTPAAV